MKHRLNLLILLAFISLFHSSCSTNNALPPEINNEIRSETISSNEVSSEQNNIPLAVTYMAYEEQYRFIRESATLLWMPCEGSPKVTDLSNILVEVLFAGYTTEENIWLYVTYRTYDTPTNNRGWIMESNTEKYTKNNQSMVRDIIIPKGIKGVDTNENDVENYDQFGLIEKEEEDRVLVIFAGGKELWYYKKDIRYPPLK